MTRARRPRIAAPIVAAVAIITSLLPLTTLLIPSWFLPASAAALAVLAAGYGGRWIARGAAIAAELVVVVVAIAWAFPGAVFGGLVPWAGEWRMDDALAAAFAQIVSGIAPVDVGPPLAFVIVAAAAILAVVVDALAISARLPLVAAIPLVSVFATPQLAVPRGDHLALAVPLALALLALVAVAGRRPHHRARPRGSVGAIGLAVVAVLVALVIAPRIPVLPAADSAPFARPSNIDVSIDLGDDLRSRSTQEVLRVRTDVGPTPYLRLATHSRFDENGWQLDGGASRPLSEGFDPRDPSGLVGEVAAEPVRTWITDVELDTGYLPLPGATARVAGTTGEWSAMLDSGTARSSSSTTEGERYRAESTHLSPTRAQLDASPWVREASIGGSFVDPGTGENVREDIPRAAMEVPAAVVNGPIGEAARDVTSDETTPYGAALRLQEWLRSSAFRYSLDAPVDEGFDGSDREAVERFLEVRAGYCVHFASTYALMARSLGIPTRLIVGYLPGEPTGESIDGMSVSSVAADRLHAWPEVYLVGIGWTPFDPTPAVAQARSIVLDTSGGGADDPEPTRAPDDPIAETNEPSAEPTDEAADSGGSEGSSFDGAATIVLYGLMALVAAILVAAIPGLVRLASGATRRRAAGEGDVGAAWRELRAIAVDAGLDPVDAESPRAFGHRLVDAGAPAADVGALVRAIEHRSFARDPSPPAGLATALAGVERALRPRAASARLRRRALPRSLWAGSRSVSRR